MSTVSEQAVVFDCQGEQCIGIVHAPTQRRGSVGVVVVVGGPQYRVGSHRQFVHLARHLAGAGLPVLRFDYRGMGDSSGEARDFRSVGDDIAAAVDTLQAAVPDLSAIVLFGLCDAASAVTLYCGGDDRICGLILANPWVTTPEGVARVRVKHYYGGRLLQGSFWRKLTGGRVDIPGALAGLMRSLFTAARGRPGGRNPDRTPDTGGDFVVRMRRGLEGYAKPVLLLVSGRDLTAREFLDLCAADADWGRAIGRPSVEIESLPTADHTFSEPAATTAVNSRCEAWISKHWPAANL